MALGKVVPLQLAIFLGPIWLLLQANSIQLKAGHRGCSLESITVLYSKQLFWFYALFLSVVLLMCSLEHLDSKFSTSMVEGRNIGSMLFARSIHPSIHPFTHTITPSMNSDKSLTYFRSFLMKVTKEGSYRCLIVKVLVLELSFEILVSLRSQEDNFLYPKFCTYVRPSCSLIYIHCKSRAFTLKLLAQSHLLMLRQ